MGMGKWQHKTTFTACGYADADVEAKNGFRWRMEAWLMNPGEG
jgi:hypothetical protein